MKKAAHVCAQICTLVREEGFRFKDICIIARDLGTYGPILAQMGRRYGLPLFLDEREGVSHKPLMLFVLCALQIVSNHWQMDDVLSYLRCELLGFTPYEIACFENYVYIWNIKGASLKDPFFLHPQGLKGAFTAEDTQLLALLESMRAQMTAPLVKLAKACKAPTARALPKRCTAF